MQKLYTSARAKNQDRRRTSIACSCPMWLANKCGKPCKACAHADVVLADNATPISHYRSATSCVLQLRQANRRAKGKWRSEELRLGTLSSQQFPGVSLLDMGRRNKTYPRSSNICPWLERSSLPSSQRHDLAIRVVLNRTFLRDIQFAAVRMEVEERPLYESLVAHHAHVELQANKINMWTVFR